jgi:hypothetical protein
VKQVPIHFVVCLALLAGGNFHQQRADDAGPKRARTLEDYRPATLKDLSLPGREVGGERAKHEGLLLDPNFAPSRVRVEYSASTRTLSAARKDLLSQWARLYAGNPDHYTQPYETEALFLENRENYWVAVPTRLLPLLQRDFKRGERVDLLLIRVGGSPTVGKWDWIFLIEDLIEIAADDDRGLQSTLVLIRDKLPSYTSIKTTAEIHGRCELRLIQTPARISEYQVTKYVVHIPLDSIDPTKLKVHRDESSGGWSLAIRTLRGKKTISFMLYQRSPAEGGQKNEETISFVDESGAAEMAEAFRRAHRLCLVVDNAKRGARPGPRVNIRGYGDVG